MPNYCLVVGCNKNAAKDIGIRFFRVPSIKRKGMKKECALSTQRRQQWINVLKRTDVTEKKLKFGRICSLHFLSGEPAELYDVNNPDWVPNKDMGYQSIRQPKDLGRHVRHSERIKHSGERIFPKEDVDVSIADNMEEVAVQPACISKLTYEELEQQLEEAKEEIKSLKKELSMYRMEEEYFVDNDAEVQYFTGFPEYSYIQNILKEISDYLPNRAKLSKFHQLLLTLLKLRFNFHFTYLSKIFQCHRTTVARTFEKVLGIISSRFKYFIHWPSRNELEINMPSCFLEVFGTQTTVIVDCFEVFIEKPSNLEAAAKTWSNYKHHHTMKFLIAISPQGSIMYISNAYGGRASDKFITEDSGFLEQLKPGDLVIVDRGFTIEDSAKIYCAKVRAPAFLKGKKQLGNEDIEETRKLASVRVHVERVIGYLKQKYVIFQHVFPIMQLKKGDSDYALIDQIVYVCSIFINLCPGIIPLDDFV